MTVGVKSGAPHLGLVQLERQVQHIEDLDRLIDDFGANAVTRQNCNLHDHDGNLSEE